MIWEPLAKMKNVHGGDIFELETNVNGRKLVLSTSDFGTEGIFIGIRYPNDDGVLTNISNQWRILKIYNLIPYRLDSSCSVQTNDKDLIFKFIIGIDNIYPFSRKIFNMLVEKAKLFDKYEMLFNIQNAINAGKFLEIFKTISEYQNDNLMLMLAGYCALKRKWQEAIWCNEEISQDSPYYIKSQKNIEDYKNAMRSEIARSTQGKLVDLIHFNFFEKWNLHQTHENCTSHEQEITGADTTFEFQHGNQVYAVSPKHYEDLSVSSNFLTHSSNSSLGNQPTNATTLNLSTLPNKQEIASILEIPDNKISSLTIVDTSNALKITFDSSLSFYSLINIAKRLKLYDINATLFPPHHCQFYKTGSSLEFTNIDFAKLHSHILSTHKTEIASTYTPKIADVD